MTFKGKWFFRRPGLPAVQLDKQNEVNRKAIKRSEMEKPKMRRSPQMTAAFN
jgi:hypothetical protein